MQRTRERATSLSGRIKRWLDGWAADDRDGRYTSQLALLRATLLRATAQVEGAIEAAAGSAAGEAYRSLRELDGSLSFVERIWAYYRERIDQRRDASACQVLHAADDIIWSCWKPLFDAAGAAQPLPLAALDPDHAPHAVLRSEPPAGMSASDRLLREFLNELPLPVIAVPAPGARDPWMLILLAHEVGHHAQFDLFPGGDLLGRTQSAIQQASPGGARFPAWHREIFADICSVVLVGAAALPAVAELEWGGGAALLRPSSRYPAPAVRLALLAAAARAVGAWAPFLDDYAPAAWAPLLDDESIPKQLRDDARRDLGAACAIAGAVLDLSIGRCTLRGSLGDRRSDLGERGVAWTLADSFRRQHALVGEAGIDAARTWTAAATLAWRDSTAAGPEGEATRDWIANELYGVIRETRDPVTRGDEDSWAETGMDLGDRLVALGRALAASEEGALP